MESRRGRLFGYPAEEIIGKPIATLIPPDRRDEEVRILERLRNGERIDHYETVGQRKDGSLVEISLTVSPIKGADGRINGASKIARDITERREALDRQQLLLREMNHRVKNLFALAGSVVTLSARSAGTPGELAESVRQRLGALARAHDLTLPNIAKGEESRDRATTLAALVRTIVSPYVTEMDARVTISGPDVSISGSAVMSMALLLHEISTNAAEYGALSSQSGRVDVSWSLWNDELLLAWREHGGPALNGQPEHEGFGSLLARLTVTGQLAGKDHPGLEPGGLDGNPISAAGMPQPLRSCLGLAAHDPPVPSSIVQGCYRQAVKRAPYPTKDEADEAHAKIAEALEKAVEVGQPGRVAKELAEVTQGPSLWR